MFGSKLLSLREQNGISQIAFANVLGVTQQCVSFWEQGKRKPTLEMIVKISEYFGCTVDELLKEEVK